VVFTRAAAPDSISARARTPNLAYSVAMSLPHPIPSPSFDGAFRERFAELVRWRRDVRRFRRDPLPPGALERLIGLAARAPSVGYSQPCRWVRVIGAERRAEIAADFARCNAEALAGYAGERAKAYASLKLAGLDEAPEHLAVFCDEATPAGHGLGRATMPETLAYSVVMAIHTLWLAARGEDIGIGWVSILSPETVKTVLAPPDGWRFIAYLCIGYPSDENPTPELARRGWETPDARATSILER
jgi:5,6-dimethylbenzimidazole synthase